MSKYVNSWIKANCKTVTLRFNVKKQGDIELYDHLQKQPNKTEYLKGLVMRDIITGRLGLSRSKEAETIRHQNRCVELCMQAVERMTAKEKEEE